MREKECQFNYIPESDDGKSCLSFSRVHPLFTRMSIENQFLTRILWTRSCGDYFPREVWKPAPSPFREARTAGTNRQSQLLFDSW